MNEFERDRISKGFADLTALLEDAAGLAVEGLSCQRSLASLREHIAQIRPLLIACVAEIALIEHYIRNLGVNKIQ